MPEGPPPHLTVELRHRIGALELDVAFELRQPWTVLFGPSGSGKSTILRAIAGLIRPDRARIISTVQPGTAARQTFVLIDTEAGIFVPPHQRAIPFAPQQPSLFPHLTVLQNVTYGLPPNVRSSTAPVADPRVPAFLDAFRIAELAGRCPAQLSGGQAQRVVLARTAAAGASRLLLLDEPFNGLEATLQSELIRQLRQDHATGAVRNILSVTHDIAEAFQLDAEVIQLSDGRIVAQGSASEVLGTHRDHLLTQLGTPARSVKP